MSKIYVVTSGEYSDYGIDAIFSTKEKAQEYITIRTNSEYIWNELEIEEYELDRMAEPPEFVFVEKDLYKGSVQWVPISDYKEQEENSNLERIRVKFHPDKKVMDKAAEDRLQMLRARDMGL